MQKIKPTICYFQSTSWFVILVVSVHQFLCLEMMQIHRKPTFIGCLINVGLNMCLLYCVIFPSCAEAGFMINLSGVDALLHG